MLRSLFGKNKKRPPVKQPPGNAIGDARVGDVVTIQGLSLEYDDRYFVVENRHRYKGQGRVWYELMVADAQYQVWLESHGAGNDLFITATADRRPVGLDTIGLTEDELISLDEEHSIDNWITVGEQRFFYRNSFEVDYFKDNGTAGEGFYLWDFLSEDEARVLAITKFEGMPFEAYFGEVIPPANVVLYPGERP